MNANFRAFAGWVSGATAKVRAFRGWVTFLLPDPPHGVLATFSSVDIVPNVSMTNLYNVSSGILSPDIVVFTSLEAEGG